MLFSAHAAVCQNGSLIPAILVPSFALESQPQSFFARLLPASGQSVLSLRLTSYGVSVSETSRASGLS